VPGASCVLDRASQPTGGFPSSPLLQWMDLCLGWSPKETGLQVLKQGQTGSQPGDPRSPTWRLAGGQVTLTKPGLLSFLIHSMVGKQVVHGFSLLGFARLTPPSS
jgi:hypothetical protein